MWAQQENLGHNPGITWPTNQKVFISLTGSYGGHRADNT